MKDLIRTRKFLVLALVVALLIGVEGVVNSSAAELTVEWTRTYGVGGDDKAWGVAVDSANNIIVTGHINGYPIADYCTIKYDPDGNVIWIKTYDHGDSSDHARAVAVDSYDNIIVSGIVIGPTAGPFDRNHTVIKYAPDGTMLWKKEHSSLSPTMYSSHVAVDSEDNIIAARVFEFTKYNSDGDIIWDRETTIPEWGWVSLDISNVTVDSQNDILITGAIRFDYSDYCYATSKYRGSDGALLWVACDPDTRSADNILQGLDVAVDSCDNVITTGRIPVAGGSDYMIKYDPIGNVLWNTSLGVASYWNGIGVAVDSSDNIFATGSARIGSWDPYPPHQRAYTIKCDPDGNVLWSHAYGEDPFSFEDYSGLDIALDSANNVIVAGYLESHKK